MKIFVGTHGVGKSTLLNAINVHYPEYYVSDGFSRPLKKAKLKLGNINSYQEQVILNELTEWAFLNYVKHKNVISGRSPIDAIIYSQVLFPAPNIIDIDSLKNTFLKNKDKIETVFYVPIEFELVDDNFRFTDKQLQKQIDDGIQQFIEQYKLTVVKLTGTIKQRMQQLNQYL